MEPRKTVTTVYYFEGYDIVSDQVVRSKRMATSEWLKKRPWFSRLEKTAKIVPIANVEDGLYREKKP